MAASVNYKHNIKVEILTPLSIGGGSESNWKKDIDYVIKGNQLFHFSLKKMIALGVSADAIAGVYANKKDITTLIAPNQLSLICDKILDTPVNNTADVKNMITNQMNGKPIIPGSSLKGAIRSALLHSMLQGKRVTKLQESDYFGALKFGEDFMRYIKIGDIEFTATELVNTKIYNLRSTGKEDWDGGWKHGGYTNDEYNPLGFNTLYECLTPNMHSNGTICIGNGSYFKQGVDSELKRNILGPNGIQTLFSTINQCTKDYLEAEKKFFNIYSDAEGSEEIMKNLQLLLELIPEDNSYCILKMAAGTGFHSITGNWQFDDFTNTGTWYTPKNPRTNGKHKYKSRKIADYKENLTLMGFVKISLL